MAQKDDFNSFIPAMLTIFSSANSPWVARRWVAKDIRSLSCHQRAPLTLSTGLVFSRQNKGKKMYNCQHLLWFWAIITHFHKAEDRADRQPFSWLRGWLWLSTNDRNLYRTSQVRSWPTDDDSKHSGLSKRLQESGTNSHRLET